MIFPDTELKEWVRRWKLKIKRETCTCGLVFPSPRPALINNAGHKMAGVVWTCSCKLELSLWTPANDSAKSFWRSVLSLEGA